MSDENPKCVTRDPRHRQHGEDMELRLQYFPPRGYSEPKHIGFTVSEDTFRRIFAPLPRNREIPFDFQAQAEAARMIKARRELAHAIAEDMAAQLLKLIEATDPQYGYSPEEWAKINGEPQP